MLVEEGVIIKSALNTWPNSYSRPSALTAYFARLMPISW
ncbi:hypothetical protein AALB_1233 [Agarivorans albus MKT 106]|uniref:Uncharacterized protein n=1 Tax=Agarivorans albus MKT 106 TaxID=1331007 RepID=R9PIS0_AGAAL|nr:hypothetical protein AALB_1233 [Agarivorans albus MKT 106]